MLRLGMFIADRYEILELIGTGGMSEVYKAKCHKLNRFVAIKILKEEFAKDPEFVAKFRQEAQSAAILSHPNIVSIFDVGDENELHYIVMELIEGITLKDYIGSKNKLDIRESIGITIQVAQGLNAAHDRQIIHRDIKPQNIIISKDAKVKVMDFGIARATSGDTINSSSNMGSVHYISPEQARGGYCDARSDIYSLGITLFEMVTGRVPFDGDNTVVIALAHVQNEFPDPREIDPDIPVSLAKIITKCTMKKPERRYATVMELITDLRKALISPNEDFVKVVSPVNNNPTKMMSPEDIAKVREGSKTIVVEQAEDDDESENSGEIVVEPGEYAEPEEENFEENPEEEDNEEEKENSKFDIVVLIVGIILAIIIIILTIFLVSKLAELNGWAPGTIHKTVTDTSYVDITEEESTTSDKKVKVPNVVGLDQTGAETLLKEQNLGIKIKEAYSEDVAAGLIIEQDPAADEEANKYSQVTVTISIGSEYAVVPEDLVGMSQTEAQNTIYNAGLYSKVVKMSSDTVESGYVISTDPASGEKISKNDIITIYISTGKEIQYVTVPDLKDMSLDDAMKAVEDLGLTLEIDKRVNDDTIEADHIISQDTEADSQVEEGSTIKVVVSDGEKTVSVDSEVGKTEAAATSYFENLGFTVTVEEVSSDTVEEGKVISQEREDGTVINDGDELAEGSAVILKVSSGKETSKVTNVVGIPKSDAKSQLENAGFKVKVEAEYNDNYAIDYVCKQTPEANSEYNKGTTVTIYVSRGSKPVSLDVACNSEYYGDEVKPEASDFTVTLNYSNGESVVISTATCDYTFGSGTALTNGSTITYTYTDGETTVTGSYTIQTIPNETTDVVEETTDTENSVDSEA